MNAYQVLNSKQIKNICNKMEIQFGFRNLRLNYVFLKSRKDKVYILSRDISKLDLSRLRVNSMGLYFCKIEKDGIRMSIEGSQVIGNLATRNVIDIHDDDSNKWFEGLDIEVDGNFDRYVLVRDDKDFLGCGMFKDRILKNYMPKSRRL